MKKFLLTGFASLALLLSLANCGKSSDNGNPNTYTAAYNPYNNNPGYYNDMYSDYYGDDDGRYCDDAYEYGDGCVTCYLPQRNYDYDYGCGGYGCGCDYYSGCGGGYQQVLYVPQGYNNYMYPQFANGGMFSLGLTYQSGWGV